MRRFLAITALLGASLTAISPAEAKSIWLKCGGQEINLDSTKERFSMQHSGKVFQGTALFSPNQINFENHWQIYPNGGGIKYSYEINRKSLRTKA